MHTLYKHQKEVIDNDSKKTGLWWGTGSGKTFVALSLARGKTLVICPKTQKEDQNWEREVSKMNGTVDLTTISKETFRRDWAILPPFDTVIIDEAETCLGVMPTTRQRKRQTIPKASQLFEAVEAFLYKYPPARLYLATATITRSPMTVWAAGKLLGKDWDYYKWREVFYVRLPMPGREVWSPRSTEECKNKLAAAVQSIGYVGRLEDWFDVPEQTFRTDWVDLTAAQTKRIAEAKIEFPDPIVAIGKRHQIENGCLNGDEYTPSELIASGKDERILKYAEEFPRLIIFAKFTQQINHYNDILTKKGYTVHLLTGATKNRDTLFTTLKQSAQAVLIVQSNISAGWEWAACGTIVFASRTYNVADYIQGQGRIQRTNAIKKNLYINLIAKNGIDKAVHDCLENKSDFNERIYTKQGM